MSNLIPPTDATSTKSYRYPGVQPFAKEQSRVFFGREQDTTSLYRLMRREALVVLYSKSGLGKSSIINAGLIPKCEATKEYRPIVIRFGAWTEDVTTTPLEISKENILKAYQAPTFLNKLLPKDRSLWYATKTSQVNGGGKSLLIFDQFEELFTYPEAAIRSFIEELSELINTGIPLRFRRMAEVDGIITEEEEDELEENLESRVLFAIRSDRIHLLDQLSDDLPNILRSMYQLQALSIEDAREAIIKPASFEETVSCFRTPPFEWSPPALEALLNYLQDSEDDHRVEGILLQMLCQYFEEKKVEGEGLRYLNLEDLGKLKDIVEDYYFEKIASLKNDKKEKAARKLIEEGLVMEGDNIRLSLHEAQIQRQYQVDKTLLERLVNSRLLRAEPFLRGGYNYELSHDRLVEPVLKAKKERLEDERRKKESIEQAEKEKELAAERRKRKKTLMFAIAMAFLAFLAIGAAIWAFSLRREAELQRQLAIDERKNAEFQQQIAVEAKDEALESKAKIEVLLKDFQRAQAEKVLQEVNDIIKGAKELEKEYPDVAKDMLKDAKIELLKYQNNPILKKKLEDLNLLLKK